jgi:hypothetical protein
MAAFPKLTTGAVMQYPATRGLVFSNQVMRFVDGREQRFRNQRSAVRRWEIRLDSLDESEMAALEQFFVETQGAYGSFSFTDPWDATVYADCCLESDRAVFRAIGELHGQTRLVVRENVI